MDIFILAQRELFTGTNSCQASCCRILLTRHRDRRFQSRPYGMEHITKPIAFDDKGHLVCSVWRARRYVPGRKSHSRITGKVAVSGTGYSRRRLAVRRQQSGPTAEGWQTIRYGYTQHCGDGLELQRMVICLRLQHGTR